ncbi:origin recognition complex subunit 2, putative [Plasmodium gallinaceum]|uniref:Origin recognition complex subunit 2, putative n=1 Tax=Plasmodium gallinaceum TaxID=5849 RepID=A0A1J1H3E9_PLAGA|nr:origin recognition complex subunit 2, putative [Plasmodium gallinaceum]CRG98023.1 origin recognition complex subunit 2, putative [Plasmodium gallinaceum]
MIKSIEVNSPKKMIRTEMEEKDEEEKEEYLITNLTEHNRNMPSVIIRIPNNLNKLLSNEDTKIDFNENIKSPNKKNQKLNSFKMDDLSININDKNDLGPDIKFDTTYKSDSSDSYLSINKSDLDDDEMNESIIKTFKSNYIEKYESNISNENVNFLREHTKNELEYFLQRKKYHSSNEMKINDIINIDYDKLNEKNIIPYFLTNMFDMEQKKKREKMKEELERKRKLMLERQKRKNSIEKGGKRANNETRIFNSKGNDKRKSLNKEKLKENNSKIEKKEYDKEIEEEEEEEEEEEDGEEEDELEGNNNIKKKKSIIDKKKENKIKRKQEKKIEDGNEDYDMYIDEFDREDIEINIHNDPTLYGIEGSSDYSEGFKSDLENTQEDETVKENTVNDSKKKKKKNNDENSVNDEKIDDIVDSSTERLISYDYYSSLNIKEFVKPSFKIKSLSPFIPVEENLDKYDDIQKLQYLIKNLPYTHIKEKRSLYHYNIKQFIKWKVYLLNNINICLYGIGSKFHILNLFSNICLNDGHKCIILGFEQDINFEEILIRVLEYHYKYKSNKNLKSYDLLYELIQLVNESNIPLYFVIHNLDNIKLYPYYEYFSFLSQYDNIFFICSIDDVSFELNMNFKNINTINFYYMKCHTWLDYRYEILRQWNKFLPEWVFNKKSEEVDVKKNIETILNALNINHKRLFKIIASIQLENLEKGIYGVEKESLLQDKRLFTVGASSIRINSLLVEFVSHNVITETRLKEGNTFLKINADKEELKRLIEQL